MPGGSSPQALGKSQHVDGAVDAGLRRLHRIVAVANGRWWTSKIIDLVDLDVEREGYVVPNDLEAMVIKQMIDIALRTGVSNQLVRSTRSEP